MDDTAMAADVVAEPRPAPPRAAGSRRGFFAFLKDGVLVTTRNRGLFLPLAALHAAESLALLAMGYIGPTLGLKANGDDGLGLHHWWLLPAVAAYLVANVAIEYLRLAIKAATACAAVASCSAASIDGGPGRTTLTLASLLGKVRRDLRGPMATAAFIEFVGWWALVFAWMLVTLAVFAAAAIPTYGARDLAALLFLLLHLTGIPLVVIYYFVPCEVAVVVSVAEPGLRAGGALRRARRFTRGAKKLAQATLHSMLSWALKEAVWKMYEVAMALVPDSTAAAAADVAAPLWLDAVVVYMLVGAVKVLYVATVTAYYFDCKRSEEDQAGHIHME